jgi:NADH-quinone oxidoreductase subunit M
MDGVAMNTGLPLLSLLTWSPIVGGIIVLLLGEKQRHFAKIAALVFSLLTLGLCIPLYTGFDSTTAAMQFVELHPWIEILNINYHLGIDGIALPLIVLTALMTVLVVVAGWEVV